MYNAHEKNVKKIEIKFKHWHDTYEYHKELLEHHIEYLHDEPSMHRILLWIDRTNEVNYRNIHQPRRDTVDQQYVLVPHLFDTCIKFLCKKCIRNFFSTVTLVNDLCISDTDHRLYPSANVKGALIWSL